MCHTGSGYKPDSGDTIPIGFTIHFLGPDPKRTPWWARRARMGWTHVALQIGNRLWDQPFRGRGKCYMADAWLAEKRPHRPWLGIDMEVRFEYTGRVFKALRRIERCKSQPIRSILRYLGLWPRPAWNCVSPIVEFLRASGSQIEANTPDDLFRCFMGMMREKNESAE